MKLPYVKRAITQIQMHKYTNTAYHKVPERPKLWYIFEKRIVQGYQNLYSYLSNTRIHIYKYKNTQIQHITKCRKDPTNCIFLKRGLFKGIKYDIPVCLTRKYKKYKYKIHKYTNTAYNKVPESLNVWYICQKRIVQGYQK